jgi:4-hydroxythreonine-4-phosphate dehydrogenase
MPELAVTMGDARGIGPEVLLDAISGAAALPGDLPLIVGVARALGLAADTLWPAGAPRPPLVEKLLASTIEVSLPGELPAGLSGGALRKFLLDNPRLCGSWAGRAVERAVSLVLGGGAAALVTAPLDKSALNAAGYHYPGHTEMLAHLAGDCPVSMMLAGGSLRVVPATTHIALSRVPSAVTQELLLAQCGIIDRGLKELFGIARPRIALCGLNPHLGDSGVAGDEDRRITLPAAQAAREAGLDVRGPYPADTVFVRAARGEFDAVLAMYHDQAMIAIKMHAFGRGVNVTLGLPFVRTSPDHGTALDIAGRGVADSASMAEALRLAAVLSRNQRKSA